MFLWGLKTGSNANHKKRKGFKNALLLYNVAARSLNSAVAMVSKGSGSLRFMCVHTYILGLLRWLNSKEWAYNVGDRDSIPWSSRFPGEGNGYPLQPSSLKNATDRGAWWATAVHGVTKRLRQDLDQHIYESHVYRICILSICHQICF